MERLSAHLHDREIGRMKVGAMQRFVHHNQLIHELSLNAHREFVRKHDGSVNALDLELSECR